ncbi:chemotaxis protein CheB [Paenibacillus sp. YPG26]|uniref:protein-glutamate methylesterase/protein-glutamine glutaminase n=1 Tax=Paenibacillus sp. YPG26 TaxID=2878915 RepID=UPI00203CF8E3|nr:chemotaxis protein CheB [Paenibacillus sp. YPG26]USB32078.1 response regulator [Paenibacillus sp. YPG26]
MRPYRILVVDDSAFMRKIISDLIEQDPLLKVEGTAQNGKEAIELIAQLQPDLVTMDVEMPEMNGLEALRKIMADKPIPVIMLSGINEEGMRETIMALELGAFDFIRKPSLTTSSQGIDEVGQALREKIATAMQAQERREARIEADSGKAATTRALPEPSPLPLTPPAKVMPKDKGSEGKPSADHLEQATVKPQTKPADTHQSKLRNRPLRSVSEAPDLRGGPLDKDKAGMSGRAVPKSPQAPKIQPGTSTEERLPQSSRPPAAGDVARVKTNGVVHDSKTPEREPAGRQDSRPASLHRTGTYTDIVAIGCSTGGPRALKTLLEQIPADFPAPIVIVQHMPPNFTHSLAQRLNSLSPLHVVEAEEGMEIKKGWAYIAPGGYHITVKPSSGGGYRIELNKDELRNGHRPSADVLYESLQPLESLKRHIVLLTGMGSDGARVMKRLYDAGVTSTFAESEETCVVYGMPRSAVELKCVSHVLPLHDIAPKLVQVVK